MHTYNITIHSIQEMQAFAIKLATIAQIGDVFALDGNIGVGKTVFATAFIQHLTNQNTTVPSPTFTLVETYISNSTKIIHSDLYRIDSPQEFFNLGLEDEFFNSISIIEWAKKFQQYLPRNTIFLEFTEIQNNREITIKSKNQNNIQRILNANI